MGKSFDFSTVRPIGKTLRTDQKAVRSFVIDFFDAVPNYLKEHLTRRMKMYRDETHYTKEDHNGQR